jgi:hypothetical protein
MVNRKDAKELRVWAEKLTEIKGIVIKITLKEHFRLSLNKYGEGQKGRKEEIKKKSKEV